MQRIHVHIRVENLQPSIEFYTKLLGAAPVVVKKDYAKWSSETPALNLAISNRGVAQGVVDSGIAHLGIEMDDVSDVATTTRALDSGDVWEEGETTCCYAQSEKSWAEDPQGVRWEIFHTHGESQEWGNEKPAESLSQVRCCG
jgi:catechol 2,3-dioxygenase-like lactoylglutathione lyase family enzyme